MRKKKNSSRIKYSKSLSFEESNSLLHCLLKLLFFKVLRHINLKVEPGQTIAVMGATGAGKSTLCLLLGRFYDVMQGRVLVDGVDVRDQKLDVLRREIGYVPQETFLFSDTLEDNIRFGRVDAPHERVVQAADVACAT